MQAAKKAVETIKETAANIGASAKSGLEKTKATIQEKSEKMSAHDQTQKDMATKKKEERINQAEMEKQQAREYNAAAKQSAIAGHMTQGHYTTTGPGPENAVYSNTGPGTDTATYNTTGPRTETATYNTGPGHENAAVYSNTRPGPGTATYPTGEYGQMGANHTPAMSGHGHGHGPGHGGLTEEVVGSRTIETNTGVDPTTHNAPGARSGPPSGPNYS
ncbi:18 kDa seed maturation protein [Spatholobus suberectus]|nr:18 kDa seed maturation protein [Spatholobus suberectus]